MINNNQQQAQATMCCVLVFSKLRVACCGLWFVFAEDGENNLFTHNPLLVFTSILSLVTTCYFIKYITKTMLLFYENEPLTQLFVLIMITRDFFIFDPLFSFRSSFFNLSILLLLDRTTINQT